MEEHMCLQTELQCVRIDLHLVTDVLGQICNE